ncbi:hypothetical protein RB195_012081 [Necator americanus]|uniref:WH2 domain-containing protein n=1 Tax=Necator americanus TaxID=51031 RepID=A0ABR1D5F1_NECAM
MGSGDRTKTGQPPDTDAYPPTLALVRDATNRSPHSMRPAAAAGAFTSSGIGGDDVRKGFEKSSMRLLGVKRLAPKSK